MLDIVDCAARQHFYGASEAPGEHAGIEGWEHLDRVVTIDQAAIWRTPRSNAATYTGAWAPPSGTTRGDCGYLCDASGIEVSRHCY